jgi:hypothetical protein
MSLRVRLQSKSIKPELKETIDRLRQRVQEAAISSSEKLAEVILSEGRADIARAGRFGNAWTSGFTYEITGDEGGKTRSIVFHHSNPLWRVFQSGATIQGKPLLWIPVDPGGPRARDFPGRLFQVKRRGKRDTPLLMSADDKQVKYIGVKKVIIRRKFHLLKIIRDETKKLKDLFTNEMKKA